jgi:hypothetical protein
MKTLILILAMTTVVCGQQRNSRLDAVIPAPGSAGTVTLSLSEYNRLSELASNKTKAPDAVPLPFALSRAAFKLRVLEQSVRGTVDIQGALLAKSPTKVPLTRGLTILEARQATASLPLLQEGTIHSAILNGPGPFAVVLDVASDLTVEAGRASFTIVVPSSSSSLLTLDLPGNHANVRIEPGLITSRTTDNGHTIVEATLEPGKPARVWWTTREVAAPLAQREVRFLSDVKSVVSVGDSQLRLTALCNLTVIQGESADFRMPVPAGYELTEAAGTTLDTSEVQGNEVILRVRESAKRSHQFLVVFERANQQTKIDAPLVTITGAQRETGEVLVEGSGSIELTAKEDGGLRRMDVREAGALVRSLSHSPLQAAFRYNRHAGDLPKLQLEWTQFPDSSVLSAVAESATITTLTTFEGRSLTEVSLRVRNHAQPFVRIELPAGAQLLSAEVEGERVKPVVGTDGNRVPLLRTGFTPSGAYTVSFVYLVSGSRFGKAGAYQMALPRLDIPVNMLNWEVSLPEKLLVKQFGGNALAAELFPAAAQNALAGNMYELAETDSDVWEQSGADFNTLGPGQVGGIVTDPNGAVVPGATVELTNSQTGATISTKSDGDGHWVLSGLQPGAAKLKIESPGFKSFNQEFQIASDRPTRLGTTLDVGAITESVTVTADSLSNMSIDGLKRIDEQARKRQEELRNAPSQNVINLQRRVAGILPVRVEVPRSGKSYRFVRPLVLDEETVITFQYKSK